MLSNSLKQILLSASALTLLTACSEENGSNSSNSDSNGVQTYAYSSYRECSEAGIFTASQCQQAYVFAAAEHGKEIKDIEGGTANSYQDEASCNNASADAACQQTASGDWMMPMSAFAIGAATGAAVGAVTGAALYNRAASAGQKAGYYNSQGSSYIGVYPSGYRASSSSYASRAAAARANARSRNTVRMQVQNPYDQSGVNRNTAAGRTNYRSDMGVTYGRRNVQQQAPAATNNATGSRSGFGGSGGPSSS